MMKAFTMSRVAWVIGTVIMAEEEKCVGGSWVPLPYLALWHSWVSQLQAIGLESWRLLQLKGLGGWPCGSYSQFLMDTGPQQTVENSSTDGNTRPPDLPLEKSVCSLEATVRTGHGTTDWFQIGKGVHQGCTLSPCLFNLYAEYIMRNAGAGRSTSWNQDCHEKYQ